MFSSSSRVYYWGTICVKTSLQPVLSDLQRYSAGGLAHKDPDGIIEVGHIHQPAASAAAGRGGTSRVETASMPQAVAQDEEGPAAPHLMGSGSVHCRRWSVPSSTLALMRFGQRVLASTGS